MAKKKQSESSQRPITNEKVEGLRAEIVEQPITETLEVNYMPYAISVIVSRAIPEIDGFKPSHRKLLYTMYQMKLLGGSRTKSANVVGATMKLNPHGDGAIYETMVRLSRGYGALLHPLVDSKGNFGKVYSRDMAYAASRYTEVRLDAICNEVFRDIERDTVDFMPNYDGSLMEPTLLPTTFPNILVSANQGIAVGMASNLCGFNLGEVCDATIARIRDEHAHLMDTLKAPDLPTGGELLFQEQELSEIYRTGRGSFKVRSRWRHVPKENLIEIYEIPYSTTVEAVIAKVTDLVKAGRIREIADMRDETDLSGLKLTIDLKRGVEPDKLMQKLFRMTSLQDSISCNFNVLVEGMPRVMGVGEILDAWIDWRMVCIKRQTAFTIQQKKDKLHLLLGLREILLDIDRAIRIIRETEEDSLVIPHLMQGFGIDEIQADYVADIRLRNINKEYILKRLSEVEELERDIADLQDLMEKPARIRKLIVKQLEDVKKKYALPRKTSLIYEHELEETYDPETEVSDYPVYAFLSKEGYLKKITPQSLRMSGEQKYKEGDGPYLNWETTNLEELLVFTNRMQCYKVRLSDFDDSKASLLGDYLPAKLEMEEGEAVVWACLAKGYAGQILLFFENGKVARVEAGAYQTVTRRKKLTGAYSDKSPLAAALRLQEETEVAIYSTEGRVLIFGTETLTTKNTRSTQGVAVMTLKPKYQVQSAAFLASCTFANPTRYRARSLPAAGALLKEEDREEEQLSLL
ncbi:MAG: topoisomerase [Evtepia sp.]|jgi:DNA gyrase subunit A|nr:topoisomerase [Evtepia sp.]